jgi:hypothetical protein
MPSVSAAPITTGWIPLFKGVEYMTGTNSQSSGDFTSLMVAHLIRVDLSDPDIRLLPTPQITNYLANSRETSGQTVSRFVKTHGLQLGVNANFFSPTDYYMPEGTPMQLSGLAISDGSLVSVASATYPACVLFDVNRTARIIDDNWPAASTNGVLHALAGDYPLVVNGVNISRRYLNTPGVVHEQHPRTAFGVSRDGKTFYIVCIDGRQDHSVGAFEGAVQVGFEREARRDQDVGKGAIMRPFAGDLGEVFGIVPPDADLVAVLVEKQAQGGAPGAGAQN